MISELSPHCILKGPVNNNDCAFSMLHKSLLYQSSRIGIKYKPSDPITAPDNVNQAVYTLTVDQLESIRCSLSAWHDDPQRAGSEASLQAACGLMSVHGRASGQLQPLGLPYLSILTATLAIQGMMASAVGQMRGGQHKHVRLSMIQAGLLSTAQYLAAATVTDDKPECFHAGCASTTLRPPFISKDGVVFELETLKPEPWQYFCRSINVSALVAGQSWKSFLLRYATAQSDMPKALHESISQLTYDELLRICKKSHVHIYPQTTLHNRMDDKISQSLWQQGPWYITPSCQFGPSLMAPLLPCDLPLHGITVIESCRRIQGPLAGHLLANLGATVVRLEQPGGDPLRLMPPIANGCSARFDALNRLKNIHTVDIKSPQGQTELKEMVSQAHVFLHNWAPGKATELGLDANDLHRINPNLVYAYAGGWSAAQNQNSPPKTNELPGTDFMVQAYSGIADQIARSSNIRGGSLFTVLDVLGGAITAQAVTTALLQRCFTGQGARVDSSLLGAATLLNAEKYQRFLTSDPSEPEPHHWHIVANTSDGVICIECLNNDQLQTLALLLDLDTNNTTKQTLTAQIKQQAPAALIEQPSQYWIKCLQTKGLIVCEVADDLATLSSKSYAQPCLTVNAYTQANSPWSFN